MDRKTPTLPPRPVGSREEVRPALDWGARLRRRSNPSRQWLWLGGLLILGVLLVSIVSVVIWNWLRALQLPGSTAVAPTPISSFMIQRSAPYGGLNFTILSAQYATFFADDPIHSGPAIVRLTLQVTNNTTNQIAVIYYDVARLLVPKL